MGKRLTLIFCVLFLFAVAVPAFAAVQNVKVSGDILARFIARNNFDTAKDSAGTDDSIHVFNTVTRLRVDADLTDNVSTVVRLINERNWNEADFTNNRASSSTDNTNDTNIQLDLAYATMKEFLYSPLTLTIGRQELHFGNDMIIGDGVGRPRSGLVQGGIGTNQTTNYREATGYQGINGDLSLRKAFDAIRATLNYDPLVIDLVYAKIRSNVVINGTTNDDMDLYGMNAGYKFCDNWSTLVEGYFWSKRNKASIASGSLDSFGEPVLYQKGKGSDVEVVGGRISTNPMKKVNVQQEFAYEFGESVDSGYLVSDTPFANHKRDISAFAAQSMVMVTPGWKYNPTMGLIYSYFSGEANPNNNSSVISNKKWHAWDPMFENQTGGHIINALFPSSNIHDINLTAKLTPMEDITLSGDYVVLIMARGLDAHGSATSQAALNDYPPFGFLTSGNSFKNGKKFLGQELDLNLLYDYTEDVQFGLLAGWFWPGTAYGEFVSGSTTEQKVTASELIASCNVKF